MITNSRLGENLCDFIKIGSSHHGRLNCQHLITPTTPMIYIYLSNVPTIIPTLNIICIFNFKAVVTLFIFVLLHNDLTAAVATGVVAVLK